MLRGKFRDWRYSHSDEHQIPGYDLVIGTNDLHLVLVRTKLANDRAEPYPNSCRSVHPLVEIRDYRGNDARHHAIHHLDDGYGKSSGHGDRGDLKPDVTAADHNEMLAALQVRSNLLDVINST